MRLLPICIVAASMAAGCGSNYATPGRAADLSALGVTPDARRAMTNSTVQATFDRRPLARFPAAIAVARIQAPGYRSMSAESWGTGRYSLVTIRDVEDETSMEKLEKLPMVLGVAPINRLLMNTGGQLNSDLELRQAAAALQADVLLVYTFDTVFFTDDILEPLTVISLGLAPNRTIKMTSTVSAVLMDTRNGYVYGVAEATEKGSGLTNAWGNDRAVDRVRQGTESQAFAKLVEQLEKTWYGVLRRNAGNVAPAAAYHPYPPAPAPARHPGDDGDTRVYQTAPN